MISLNQPIKDAISNRNYNNARELLQQLTIINNNEFIDLVYFIAKQDITKDIKLDFMRILIHNNQGRFVEIITTPERDTLELVIHEIVQVYKDNQI